MKIIVAALPVAAIAFSASAISHPRARKSVTVASHAKERAPNPADVSRPAGIYLLSEGHLVRIDFNVSGQNRTNGMLATYLTAGISHMSIKAVLQGEQANVRTNERLPKFYFYLPDAVNSAGRSSFETAATSGPTSPNEFFLVRLQVKKGNRELRVARMNIGGVSSGVQDRDQVKTRADEVRPGVFAVTPVTMLEPGEFAFVWIGAGGAKHGKYFDFSITP